MNHPRGAQSSPCGSVSWRICAWAISEKSKCRKGKLGHSYQLCFPWAWGSVAALLSEVEPSLHTFSLLLCQHKGLWAALAPGAWTWLVWRTQKTRVIFSLAPALRDTLPAGGFTPGQNNRAQGQGWDRDFWRRRCHQEAFREKRPSESKLGFSHLSRGKKKTATLICLLILALCACTSDSSCPLSL